MAINTTLFPPVTTTYAPTFLVNGAEGCKIYFDLSEYNNILDIANVQVVIRNQNTNLSMLDKVKYPSEIKLAILENDMHGYYIQILKDDMQGGQFVINEYYKVQLRFTSILATSVSLETPQAIDAWIAANIDNFSEWSKVTLAKGISNPTMELFSYEITTNNIVDLAQSNGEVFGKLIFENPEDNEILDSYSIELYDINGILLYSTGWLYKNTFEEINTFSHTLEYHLVAGTTYGIKVNYITNNNYTSFKTDSFTARPNEGILENININAFPLDEQGLIEVQLKKYTKTPITKKYVIRRSSSITNFTIWEDIRFYNYNNSLTIKESFYDNTVEIGVWYKYGLQEIKENSEGLLIRSELKSIKLPIIILSEDMFLVNNQRQLKIQFNPTVSNFKLSISETKTDTIGSKYPFVRRNGAMQYKTFTIGGLISAEIDDNQLFATEKEILGNAYELYNYHREENDIIQQNDYLYERLFREKVIEYLNSNTTMLFKSINEGNILVKLMNVTLTPNITLGRRLWSFTANAVEIDESNISNYFKYNILPTTAGGN